MTAKRTTECKKSRDPQRVPVKSSQSTEKPMHGGNNVGRPRRKDLEGLEGRVELPQGPEDCLFSSQTEQSHNSQGTGQSTQKGLASAVGDHWLYKVLC